MKLISFVVPSYNASQYLDKNVSSLLVGQDDVEIIIVNDGSSDNTLQIAQKYQKLYPNIVKVIDKENGGHGSTINAALDIATGLYFKCVDADDWLDKDAYLTLLDTIKKHIKENNTPDVYVCNFVYENLAEKKSCVDTHKKHFKVGEVTSIDEVKRFKPSEFLMMHNLIHKLSILKESNIKLPEHTYYVDNLYVYIPLYYIKTVCYLDIDLYRYYVGRPNQSVTFENMTKNYQMQLKVMEEMALRYSYEDLKKLSRKHYKMMIHELLIISGLTLFYVDASLTDERRAAYKAYLNKFKYENHKLYCKIKYRTWMLFTFMVSARFKSFVVMKGYKHICRKTHWN